MELKGSLVNAEAVVRRVLLKWFQKFKALENQAIRQRADDVLDLGRNILRRLRGQQEAGKERSHSAWLDEPIDDALIRRVTPASTRATVVRPFNLRLEPRGSRADQDAQE